MGTATNGQVANQMLVDILVQEIERLIPGTPYHRHDFYRDVPEVVVELARNLGGPQEITEKRVDDITTEAARKLYRMAYPLLDRFERDGGTIGWTGRAAEVVADEEDKIDKRRRVRRNALRV